MKIEVRRARSGTLYWRDASFWQLDITPDHETTGGDAAAFAEAIREFGSPNKRPLLIYRAAGSLPSFEALAELAKAAPELVSAVAYWVVSEDAARTSKLVRDVFLTTLPVEVFTSEVKAIRWIEARLAEFDVVRSL